MAVQISISHQPTLKVLCEVWALPFPVFLVGGAMRDLILHGQVQDVDTIVLGDAWEPARLLASRLRGTSFEMHDTPVTVRVVASDTSLPHIDLVQIDGKRKGKAWTEAVKEDLLRRDFTINAMAGKLLQIENGLASLELADPCGGREDLSARVLRPVSEAALTDDPVRMLRCFRLAASLGFEIAPEALQTVRQSHHLIRNSASERIREEFLLLLDITPCLAHARLILETGLLYEIIPELQAAEGVAQDGYHHLDVLEHTVETLKQLEEMLSVRNTAWVSEELMRKALEHLAQPVESGFTRMALLKLAVLLHDVGKPQTRTVEADGRVRFIGHNMLGAEMTREVGRRLRLGKRAVEMVARMVREHLRPGLLAAETSPTERALNRFLNQMGDLAVEVLLLELADRLATRGPAPRRVSLERHARFTCSLLATYWERAGQAGPPRLVDGNEIMARFNIRPGPLVGQLLGLVVEAQQEGRVATKEEALSLLDEVFPSASRQPPAASR